MPNIDIYEMSDRAIAGMIGQRIEQIRLECNLSQEALADRVGISPKTYRKLVDEGGKLETVIAVLRSLDRLEYADSFIPKESISPLELVKLKGKERQRASRKPAASATNDLSLDKNAELDW
jgi:DNA-binding XRE family transcriptional regulator